MRHLTAVFAAIVMSTLCAMQTARADTTANLVRILCAPDISFYQLETLAFWNIEAERLEPAHGIITLSQLEEAPPRCKLGSATLRIVVYHKPSGNGECGAIEWARLAFWLDDWEIDVIENSHMTGSHCTSDLPYRHHLVSITQNRYMRCSSDFEQYENTLRRDGEVGVGTSCKTIQLDLKWMAPPPK